uniref:heavy-metal-associated domain-containing protein n=1 Tax=uncultured Dysgonomonas sp. TaxID=206096 RepID=UPI00262BB561|nr:heavy metal-associated domain-containing protein [uncultured Dysgonomonas sp.]
MKARIVLIVMLCLASLSFSSYAQDKKDKNADKKEVTFDVSMTCDNCKKRIEKNIAFEKGVTDMQVDLPAKTVMVVYHANKTNQEKLQKAIEKLGYEVKVHEPTE